MEAETVNTLPKATSKWVEEPRQSAAWATLLTIMLPWLSTVRRDEQDRSERARIQDTDLLQIWVLDVPAWGLCHLFPLRHPSRARPSSTPSMYTQDFYPLASMKYSSSRTFFHFVLIGKGRLEWCWHKEPATDWTQHPGPRTLLSHLPLPPPATVPLSAGPVAVWGPAQTPQSWMPTSVLTASSEGLIRTTVSNTSLRWWRIFCPASTKTQTKEETFSFSGLNPPGLLLGRWSISASEEALQQDSPRRLGKHNGCYRTRVCRPPQVPPGTGSVWSGAPQALITPSFSRLIPRLPVGSWQFSSETRMGARKTQRGSWHFLSHGNWGCFCGSVFLLVRTVLRLIRSLIVKWMTSRNPG